MITFDCSDCEYLADRAEQPERCPECGALNPHFVARVEPSAGGGSGRPVGGTADPVADPVDPAASGPDASQGRRFGWRLTLSNHAVLRLDNGAVHIGRESGPERIRTFCRLFGDVSKKHLSLNVTDRAVVVEVHKTQQDVRVFLPNAGDIGQGSGHWTPDREIKPGHRYTCMPGETCLLYTSPSPRD